MNALAIIQARVGSSRLPGKVLEPLAGIPMLTHVIRRVKATSLPLDVVLAIPDTAENDPLAAIGEAESVRVYRGSETDVLARFYWAAELVADADPVVRITADDPFKDPTLIDTALGLFLAEWANPQNPMLGAPEFSAIGGYSWPTGCDVEVFTRRALTMAFQQAKHPHDREHVTPWMIEHLGAWYLKNPRTDKDHNIGTRWTVDTPLELAYARHIYDTLYEANPTFGYAEMVTGGF